MWSVWTARNDRKHGKTPIDPKLAIEWALDACFLLLPTRQQQGNVRQPREQWKFPPHNVVKIICDGDFSPDNMTGSTGVVLCDSRGSFLGALSRGIPTVSTALAAEAEGCRDGLRMVLEGGFRRVVIETDSLQFVTIWKNRRQQRSEIAVILEMKESASTLISFDCIHAKRSANEVAHLCAKYVTSSSCSFVWHEPPSFLLPSLQRDCNPGQSMNEAMFLKKRSIKPII
jgi:ribonuclease HI